MEFNWEEVPHAEREHINERNKAWDDSLRKTAEEQALRAMAEFGIEPERLEEFMDWHQLINVALEG